MISVGTTSCRTLESATGEDGILHAGSGWTEIFIYPGYRFKMIDGLITNFHLPESTLDDAGFRSCRQGKHYGSL